MNMEKMLKTAAANLKIEPDELKALLSKGDVNAIMSKMNDKDAQRLKDALADPDTAKHLRDTPEVAKMMKENQK